MHPRKREGGIKVTKNVTISINITAARKVLSIAGFCKQAEEMSDDEIFQKVLSMIECYGATSTIDASCNEQQNK